MRPEGWHEVKRLVAEALELPTEERADFIAAIEDGEVRKEAEHLLAVSRTEIDRFEHLNLAPMDSEFPFKEGDQVGRYVIAREISRGGMGVVYQARDTGTERTVALKILPLRIISLAANEDKVLARLTHENIATFYESGVTEDGFSFLALEYVEGISITSYCARHCPTVQGRLELFRKVCEAVEYAHQNLVVHRDIKPDNILVTKVGTPKLLDFGIAKILPSDLRLATRTRLADRPMTIAFASPEQLGEKHTTTTSDVYSLGVLLCLLLTGRLPYKAKSLHDLVSAIRNEEPERPSALVDGEASERAEAELPEGGAKRLKRRLEGDLDAIVLKALRKEPAQRYGSVAELSEDIRRYLDHEPVTAGQGTLRYRAGKFARRHRLAVLVGSAALLALLAFTAELLILKREALRERDAARREAKRAEATATFLIDMFKVSNPWTALGSPITAREVLDEAARKLQADPREDASTTETLEQALGKINLNLGNYAPAAALLEGALHDLRASGSTRRPLIAEVLADLASVRYYQAKYLDAERYALEAERSLGETPEILSLLGRIAFARGDFGSAEASFRRSLTAAEGREHGPSLGVARAANDLGCALHAQGRYSQAAKFYAQSLITRGRILGDRHQATLQVFHNLACLTGERGDLRTAESNLREVRRGYRTLYDPNYPSLPALFHNTGSVLVSEGKLDEAETLLFDSLSGYRLLFPDEHPHIGRALAEIGRLLYAQGRYEEAEKYLEAGLRRLEAGVGSSHPDSIVAESNLAVLLARTGRVAEAEQSWRELLVRIDARPGPQRLDALVRENLTALGSRRNGDLKTAGIEILDLTETPDYTDAQQETRPSPSLVSNPSTIRFFDDFDDGKIDLNRWEVRGSTVAEENGTLRLLTTATDRGGQARTRPISIDPGRSLTISRRARIHAGNRYFDGKMVVEFTGYPEKSFGVSHADYHYTGAGEEVTVGFSIFRRNASAHRFAERRVNVSELIPPIWDRWFDEALRYDPRTGEVRYSIDGHERLAYNVGPLPPNASTITLYFFPWGWYTGHSEEMDWIRVEQ